MWNVLLLMRRRLLLLLLQHQDEMLNSRICRRRCNESEHTNEADENTSSTSTRVLAKKRRKHVAKWFRTFLKIVCTFIIFLLFSFCHFCVCIVRQLMQRHLCHSLKKISINIFRLFFFVTSKLTLFRDTRNKSKTRWQNLFAVDFENNEKLYFFHLSFCLGWWCKLIIIIIESESFENLNFHLALLVHLCMWHTFSFAIKFHQCYRCDFHFSTGKKNFYRRKLE